MGRDHTGVLSGGLGTSPNCKKAHIVPIGIPGDTGTWLAWRQPYLICPYFIHANWSCSYSETGWSADSCQEVQLGRSATFLSTFLTSQLHTIQETACWWCTERALGVENPVLFLPSPRNEFRQMCNPSGLIYKMRVWTGWTLGIFLLNLKFISSPTV